MLITTCSFSIK